MNISDAAREAVYPICDICNVSTYKNRDAVEQVVQTAINTATAALTLELETVKQQLADAREGLVSGQCVEMGDIETGGEITPRNSDRDPTRSTRRDERKSTLPQRYPNPQPAH